MSNSIASFGISNHAAGPIQHGCGLSPDHVPGLPARQFRSLLAVQPERATVLR